MTRRGLVLGAALLLLGALLGAQTAAAAERPLSMQDIIINSASDSVYAPDVALGGRALAVVPAAGPNQCAAACASRPDCGWFNYCGSQDGCKGAGENGSTLGHQQCLLMASNCTLTPPVLYRTGEVTGTTVSGFNLRSNPPPPMPGLVLRVAEGLEGGDFDCGSPLLPGRCAFPSVLFASAACINAFADRCRSIMVYENGTNGCSNSTVAILKESNLAPANRFVGPTVYVLERAEGAPTGGFILASEATVVAEAPANPDSTNFINSTEWLGYFVANVAALAAGDVVATVSGLPNAAACAKECRQRSPKCNVFNYCTSEAGGCSFRDLSTEVVMQAQQCELRYQALADPAQGGPPFLLAKGAEASGFQMGSPLVGWGPEVPGFTRHLGSGLWGQKGYTCSYSATPEVMECLLEQPVDQAAARCAADPVCSAVIYKPTGVLGKNIPISILRSAEGAIFSRMLATPSSMLYEKQAQSSGGSGSGDGSSTGSGSGSSGGLSTAAIVGIAVACAVVLVAALASAWMVRRERHAQPGGTGDARAVAPSATAAAADDKLLESVEGFGAGTGTQSFPRTLGSSSGDTTRSSLQPTQSLRGMLGQPLVATVGVAGVMAAEPGGALGVQHQQQLLQHPAAAAEPPMPRVVIGPPPLASPFAAMRHVRLPGSGPSAFAAGPPLATAASAAAAASKAASGLPSRAGSAPPDSRISIDSSPGRGGGTPSSLATSGGDSMLSGPQAQPDELEDMMSELLAYRAHEVEAAAAMPNSLGVSAGSGQTAATSGSLPGTTSSGGSSGLQLGGVAALPANLQAWLIPRSDIEYQRQPNGGLAVLGEGASGRVIRATYNGECVAAKELKIGRGLEAQEAFLMEAQRMQALHHPHVITFYGMALDGSKGVLVMELCEGQDLGSALPLRDSSGQRLFGWYRHGCRIALEVATALNFLHSKSIVHMDIKSSNVLLSAHGVAKVSDVGLSRRIDRTYMSDLPFVVGTFAWVAPEILMGGRHCTKAVDIFSFSVLLWEIITGERPVRGSMRQPRVPEECPQEAVDLMSACGALEPTARPSAQQVMQQLRAMQAMRRSSSRRLGEA